MINNVYTDEEVIHGIVNQDPNILLFIYLENYKHTQEYLKKKVGDKSNVTDDIFEIALFTTYFSGRDGLLKLNGSFQTYLLSLVKVVWQKENGMRSQVEGKFGQGKNGYNLNKVRARTARTSESWIACIFFVMNLIKFSKEFLFSFVKDQLKCIIELFFNIIWSETLFSPA